MSSIFVNLLVQLLRQVLPVADGAVGLHEPHLGALERQYVNECLESGWVSSAGGFVDRFEAELCRYTGARCAVAVVNGTAALQLCLILAGVEQGDEVLIPALSFVATANAVAYCNATPHFVDSEMKTLGLDPARLRSYLEENAEMRDGRCINTRTGRRIKAVVAMHSFGHPVDLERLDAVCRDFGMVLVEDAAQALGSFYRGRHTGNWGTVAALSFNGNKIITTGGGGAVLTNDPELGRRAKHLSTTAKVAHRWEFQHDQVGYNFRLPNLNAALGCAQMERLPAMVQNKRALAERYRDAFDGVEGVRLVTEPDSARSNYWLNALLLDEELSGKRDLLLAATHEIGVMTRPAWSLLHRMPMFAHCPRMPLPVAESLERRLINIPSSAFLGESHVKA